MLLRDAHDQPLWLSYGMNVHPGGDAPSTLEALRHTVAPLRERLAYSDKHPFGLALRWSAEGVKTLLRDEAMRERMKATCEEHNFVAFTGNAFVHGDFHGRPIKDEVYRPAWSHPDRVTYTLAFARAMATGAEPGSVLSLSTSPGHFAAWDVAGNEEALWAANVVRVAEGLRSLRDETGVTVILGIEPEPACALQTTDEVLAFFQGPLEQAWAAHADAQQLKPFVGVCFDVCHQAVVHENVVDSLDRLKRAGIPIAKVQASSALELPDPHDGEARIELATFAEPVYLHQVGMRDASGALHVASDLGDVLDDVDRFAGLGPWRVHFHVPVFRTSILRRLSSTQDQLIDALAWIRKHGGVSHVEVETYTWDVLPAEERDAGAGHNLVEGLARELEFVEAHLGATRELS